ncbi:MAG: mercury transporter [Deltaproteobacteria bacterium]|nr:MAG: mercury transporter [Deltaproteobacteria bacterium]
MSIIGIEGMRCQHCVASVKKALEKIAGISEVSVDLDNKQAKYQGEVSKEAVREAVTSIGFEVVE